MFFLLQLLFLHESNLLGIFFELSFIILIIKVIPVGNFSDHIKNFLSNSLVDNLKSLAILQGLPGDINVKIIGIDDSSNERKIPGD